MHPTLENVIDKYQPITKKDVLIHDDKSSVSSAMPDFKPYKIL